jgi:hypothetical protein
MRKLAVAPTVHIGGSAGLLLKETLIISLSGFLPFLTL